MGNDTAADFRLNLLPSLLAGHLDTAYVLGFRNVQAYDKFFGEERTPGQWKAAGLELARNLNGTWFADNSIDQILRNWADDLTTYKMAYEQWKMDLIPGSLERTFQELDGHREVLLQHDTRDQILLGASA
ncbi:MAG: hypothetical protein IPL49_10785 [Saprospirales bacterium]|nr:hypothetical protein [Saprospirales bacterium]